jgi:hypothetical protein
MIHSCGVENAIKGQNLICRYFGDICSSWCSFHFGIAAATHFLSLLKLQHNVRKFIAPEWSTKMPARYHSESYNSTDRNCYAQKQRYTNHPSLHIPWYCWLQVPFLVTSVDSLVLVSHTLKEKYHGYKI